jgi:hypothetical protein
VLYIRYTHPSFLLDRSIALSSITTLSLPSPRSLLLPPPTLRSCNHLQSTARPNPYHACYSYNTTQIKPDGIQRGLVGNIMSRFEQKGYKLVALKTKQATAELLQAHYKDLVDKVCGYGLRVASLFSLRISTPLTHSVF